MRRAFHFQEIGLVAVIIFIAALLAFFRRHGAGRRRGGTANKFLRADNLLLLAKNTSFFAVMAAGMALVIITGGIDLSVGSIYALAGVCGAMALHRYGPIGSHPGTPAPLAVGAGIAACMGVGALCGLLNGLLITLLRVHPFIITLGTMAAFRGVAFVCPSWFSEGGAIAIGQSIGDFPGKLHGPLHPSGPQPAAWHRGRQRPVPRADAHHARGHRRRRTASCQDGVRQAPVRHRQQRAGSKVLRRPGAAHQGAGLHAVGRVVRRCGGDHAGILRSGEQRQRERLRADGDRLGGGGRREPLGGARFRARRTAGRADSPVDRQRDHHPQHQPELQQDHHRGGDRGRGGARPAQRPPLARDGAGHQKERISSQIDKDKQEVAG